MSKPGTIVLYKPLTMVGSIGSQSQLQGEHSEGAPAIFGAWYVDSKSHSLSMYTSLCTLPSSSSYNSWTMPYWAYSLGVYAPSIALKSKLTLNTTWSANEGFSFIIATILSSPDNVLTVHSYLPSLFNVIPSIPLMFNMSSTGKPAGKS